MLRPGTGDSATPRMGFFPDSVLAGVVDPPGNGGRSCCSVAAVAVGREGRRGAPGGVGCFREAVLDAGAGAQGSGGDFGDCGVAAACSLLPACSETPAAGSELPLSEGVTLSLSLFPGTRT